jgi:hypothetical protein
MTVAVVDANEVILEDRSADYLPGGSISSGYRLASVEAESC